MLRSGILTASYGSPSRDQIQNDERRGEKPMPFAQQDGEKNEKKTNEAHGKENTPKVQPPKEAAAVKRVPPKRIVGH